MNITQSIHIALEIWGAIFCMIAAIGLLIGKNQQTTVGKLLIGMQLMTCLLLVMDAIAWRYRGAKGDFAGAMVHGSNFLVFLAGILLDILFHMFVCVNLFREDWQEKKKTFGVRFVFGICFLAAVLLIVSQFTDLYYYFDDQNFYHRASLYWIHTVLMCLAMLGEFGLLIRYRSRLNRMKLYLFLSYLLVPFCATIVQALHYGVSISNFAISVMQIVVFVTTVVEQSRELREKERELYDMRAAMLLSQIRPHFIYNTLTIIKHLCKKDPQQAAETIDDFSNYLRGNLESLGQKKQISIERELEHVKRYVAIEKRRFGSRVNVVYEIKAGGFSIPPLTLQPIVENAIKHGICKKEEGGTVTISVFDETAFHIIRVTDDGVGFDTNALEQKRDSDRHVGIQNVENRLAYMSQATFALTSKPGVGTAVEICIPR